VVTTTVGETSLGVILTSVVGVTSIVGVSVTVIFPSVGVGLTKPVWGAVFLPERRTITKNTNKIATIKYKTFLDIAIYYIQKIKNG
jgi:hypothetical protein